MSSGRLQESENGVGKWVMQPDYRPHAQPTAIVAARAERGPDAKMTRRGSTAGGIFCQFGPMSIRAPAVSAVNLICVKNLR